MPKFSMKRLLRMNAPEWPLICFGALFSIIVGAIQPSLAFVMSEFLTVSRSHRQGRAYPSSEFVVANTLVKWTKLEPNEIEFSQGFSQKVVQRIKILALWQLAATFVIC